MAKTFIQLNSGRTKVLKGRHGGNSCRARADVDDNIKMRIQTRADNRFAAALIDDCDIGSIATEVFRPAVTKPQGINEQLFHGEAEVYGNEVSYFGDDIRVTMVLDSNGRVVSAHCRS